MKNILLIPIAAGYALFVVFALTLGILSPGHGLSWIEWLGLMTTAAGVTLLLGWSTWRRIRRPLQEITSAVETLAAGGLDRSTALSSTASVEEIRALASAVSKLREAFVERFQEAEEKTTTLEAILTSMVDGVIATDSSGRILLFNPAAERLFQKLKGEVLGKSILEVIRHYELAQAFDQTQQTGQMQLQELQLFSPQERTLQARTSPIKTAKGESLGTVAVLHDITELRRLERVRSEFVANVSHELRTPLTSLKGFIETLLDGAMADPGTCRRFLEILNKETNRLVALVNDLLDLSRVESKHFPLDLRPIDTASVLESCIHLFRQKAQDKQIDLTFQSAPGLPQIAADELLLRQVFVNLLDNAVKYTSGGGRVQVHVAGVGIKSPQALDGVQIEVSDTGAGIPAKHLDRIFERFYRVDKARSRELGGTGLGLSIVRHVIDRHGGKIEVESELGVGTTFRITLPTTPPSSQLYSAL